MADSSLYRLVEVPENIEIAIAGEISEKMIGTLKGVDIAIVGSAITGSDSPRETSILIKGLAGV